MSEILENKQYSHQEVEAKWTKQWIADEIFKVQINDHRGKFSIALPPPNVTGELHMGHALGGTIQDILIRYNRMSGKDVLWQIGTDHAGIGTQIVVEKNLRKTENKRKEDLGREKFIERVKAWKEEYGNKIIEQMKLLGFSPDYSRIRYTMDDHYAEAVKKAFIKYFNDGIIYRGNRITNWCPHCLTSLSDLEIAKEQAKKKLYSIKYKISGFANASPDKQGCRFVTVATTRPETMFGDVAVAVNPNDKRFSGLIQEINESPGSIKVCIPFVNKEIPIILDEHVKLDFGTGALKVTPAHDANDNEIATRHDLPQVIILDKQAKMSVCAEVPDWLHGLDRLKARDLVVEKLIDLEQLGEVSEYVQEKDLHDRCNTEIEPYLSDQWYVSMKQLAKLALDAESSGRSKFIPERYSSVYKNWLENIHDWCISRQIWWGHRIPVYYYEENGELKYYAAEKPKDLNHKQDEDVLDTWFSSALWPFETLKDDQKIYDNFYPTDVLATAREIINLWVSRMIYSSEYFEGKEPFKDILIHPVVQTPDGKRMSKSKGNAIDPLEMVSKYGADASRMWYASVGVYGQQDVRFPGRKDPKEAWVSDQFEQYRKFANKLFNATKYVMMQLPEGFKPLPLDLSQFVAVDRWIIYKFSECLRLIENSFANYHLEKVQEALYEFLWFDFCDWYIEFTKVGIGNKETQQQILFTVLEQSLRTLHPIMPFITEELWQTLRAKYDYSGIKDQMIDSAIEPRYQSSIAFARYPSYLGLPNLVSENSINTVQLLLSQLRNIRQTLNIAWSQDIDIYLIGDGIVSGISENSLLSIQDNQQYIKTLAKVNQIYYQEYNGASKSYKIQHADLQIQIPISDDNAAKLVEKYKKNIEKVTKDIRILESKLQSDGFISNASLDKIDEAKQSLDDFKKQISLYQSELATLS